MIVLFEGLDKTGKTTLMNLINKKTNFKYILRDRGPAGYLAYDEIYGRGTDERSLSYFKDLSFIKSNSDIRVVYCVTDWKIVQRRLEDYCEDCDYDYQKAQVVYDKWVKLYNMKKDRLLRIDTTNRTPDESIKLILDWLNMKNFFEFC